MPAERVWIEAILRLYNTRIRDNCIGDWLAPLDSASGLITAKKLVLLVIYAMSLAVAVAQDIPVQEESIERIQIVIPIGSKKIAQNGPTKRPTALLRSWTIIFGHDCRSLTTQTMVLDGTSTDRLTNSNVSMATTCGSIGPFSGRRGLASRVSK